MLFLHLRGIAEKDTSKNTKRMHNTSSALSNGSADTARGDLISLLRTPFQRRSVREGRPHVRAHCESSKGVSLRPRRRLSDVGPPPAPAITHDNHCVGQDWWMEVAFRRRRARTNTWRLE
eukprot:gene16010-biopygen8214